MAVPTTRLKRRIEEATFLRASQMAQIDFVVFLAGPFIEPDEDPKPDYSAAAMLRYNLFHMLQEEGYEVSLGEYKALIDSYKGELGEHHNAAVAELDHAQKVASLVIMIPDSPGSFAEFGAFSIKDDICRKMIILSDLNHKTSTGYLNTGPIACARSLGSEIVYIGYDDFDECFTTVKNFSNRVKSKLLLNMRLQS